MGLTIQETVLITGGSSGIGYAIAREFASRGYKLILVSNQQEQLKKVAAEFNEKFNTETRTLFLDLAAPDAAEKLYAWCGQQNLTVDILVNNAGMLIFREIVETGMEKTKNILALHTTTPALICTLFAKDMKQKRKGNIVIISSLAAYMPYPGIALYAATKRFLKSFARSLRTEMLDYQVNVTCVCPGAVSTDLYNLSQRWRNIAINTGIMMRPEKLARKIFRAMQRRKALLIPGWVNKVALPVLGILPHGLIVLIRRHSPLLPPEKQ
ncbi:MAG TPA: SDR family NAD(P)-dependent oxidoreductase [Bacteroidales bacterium]|nr:SDR family NAD(P)-dependent oxidoreductase [Bacteroidales bacterium]